MNRSHCLLLGAVTWAVSASGRELVDKSNRPIQENPSINRGVGSVAKEGAPNKTENWRKGRDFLKGRIYHSAIWAYGEMIVWGGGSDHQFYSDGGIYDPAKDEWRPTSLDGAPSGRWGHAAVWTGSEMIVWGGRGAFVPSNHFQDGAIYDPRKDSWRPMNPEGAPEARSQMAAVWTGTLLIVWGGWSNDGQYLASGGVYSLHSDSWEPLPMAGAPEARMEPGFVWTGRELIVWGGLLPGGTRSAGTGACFNPETRVWRPVSNAGAPVSARGGLAVWTGTEMVVWGGAHLDGTHLVNVGLNSGGRYNPVTDTWKPINLSGAPAGRMYHAGAWTDSEVVLWSGGDQVSGNFSDGGRYDPSSDRWLPMGQGGVPTARGLASAVWTGEGVLFFGGSTGGTSAFGDVYYYRVSPEP